MTRVSFDLYMDEEAQHWASRLTAFDAASWTKVEGVLVTESAFEPRVPAVWARGGTSLYSLLRVGPNRIVAGSHWAATWLNRGRRGL
jgi:hypothetical protein